MFMEQICIGMDFLLEAGIVHRYLKPENILFQKGTPKITDYFFAKMEVMPNKDISNFAYVAPEILENILLKEPRKAIVSQKADV